MKKGGFDVVVRRGTHRAFRGKAVVAFDNLAQPISSGMGVGSLTRWVGRPVGV
jgi:hypothetical protein